MLAYAFRVLSEHGYNDLASENFSNSTSLLAAILERGVTQLIKRGIRSDYTTTTETSTSPKGKINFADSINSQYTIKHILSYEVDVYKTDILINQILKCGISLACKSEEVIIETKKRLRAILRMFNNVSTIDPKSIKWKNIRYDRNNASYKMLINICYLLINGLIQTEEEGNITVNNIIDDQKMHRLYEKFILEYYIRHYPALSTSAARILWNTQDENIEFLPTMKSDVTIRYKGKSLVIDAKYYSQVLRNGQFDKRTIHSNNIYQIFTYVKNLDIDNSGDVSGVILYAKTEEDIAPNIEFSHGGNKFRVITLDLNKQFCDICKQLDDILYRWLGEDTPLRHI